jgi:hypothetical protein
MDNVDLWSLITVVANNSQRADDLFSVVESLPTEQKAELVKRLLKSSDLNVILQAIASRITSEPPAEEGLPSEDSQPRSDNGDN